MNKENPQAANLSKIASNSIWNLASTVLKVVAALVSSIVIARTLGPKWFGNYSYVSFIGGTFAQIAVVGFPLAMVKYISEYKGKGRIDIVNGILKFVLSIEIIMTAVVFFLALLFGRMVVHFEYPLLFLLGALIVFPLTFDYIFGASIRGAQEYGLNTKAEAIASLGHLTGIFLVVWLRLGIIGFLSLTLVYITFLMSLRIRAWGKISPLEDIIKATIPGKLKKELLGYSLVMLVNGLIILVVWERSEIFFLERFSSISDVSFYSLSFGLVTKLGEIPSSLASVLLPASSALFAVNDLAAIRKLFGLSLKFLSFLSIPVPLGLIAISRPLILLFYGPEYLQVALIVNILALFSTVVLLAVPVAAIIYGLKGHIFLMNVGIGMAVFNIILDLVLIPRYGAVGAAFANSLTQVTAAILGFSYVYSRHKLNFPFLIVGKIYAASLIMLIAASVIMFCQPNIVGLILAIPTGVVVYLLAVRGVKFFDLTDYGYLIKLVDRLPVALRPERVKRMLKFILIAK